MGKYAYVIYHTLFGMSSSSYYPQSLPHIVFELTCMKPAELRNPVCVDGFPYLILPGMTDFTSAAWEKNTRGHSWLMINH